MLMLQNVYENCVRILEEEKHRQLLMFIILLKNKRRFTVVFNNWTFQRHHSDKFYMKTLVWLMPYKAQLVQELKPVDHPMRFRFAKWVCDRLTKNANLGKKIIFSDESSFDFGGYVNKQNCRIWGTENP